MCVINGIYPIRSLQSNDWPNYIPSVHQYSTRGLVKFPADPTRCGLLSSGLTRGQIAFQTCLNAVTYINNAPAADIAAQIIVDSCLGWYKQNPCNNDVLSTLLLVWNNRSVCVTLSYTYSAFQLLYTLLDYWKIMFNCVLTATRYYPCSVFCINTNYLVMWNIYRQRADMKCS